MAGIIECEQGMIRRVLSGQCDATILKHHSYASKGVLKEMRQAITTVDVPSGLRMIKELDLMIDETKTFLQTCKEDQDVKMGLQAIRTMAKVVDSFSKVYDIADRAKNRKTHLDQAEFDRVLEILQQVLMNYPDVAQEFADALEEDGIKNAKEFEPDWETVS